MQFKQDLDGTVHASFKFEELPQLIKVMMVAEQARINSLIEVAQNNTKIIEEAAKQLVQGSPNTPLNSNEE